MSRRKNRNRDGQGRTAAPAAAPQTSTPSPAGRTFRLYPEEQHWWSFLDYGAVLDVVEQLGAKRILEFGPGSSTLALIEGGATHIDTIETDPHWAQVHEERLVSRFPAIVHLHRVSRDTQEPPPFEGPYDLALIDGPRETDMRASAILGALDYFNAAAVLVPLDNSEPIVQAIEELQQRPDLNVEIRETGPLAGSFALVTRKAVETTDVSGD